MRAVVIGGSGHVGTYLVPRLVGAGFEVVNVTRGRSAPYVAHGAWSAVESAIIDRAAAERDGTFGESIAALGPDVVIDMICFEPASARALVEALRGKVQHLLVCCSCWVHGHSEVVPTTEDRPRRPFGDYGIKKAAIEALLLDEARRNGFPATVVHPGHIVGPGHPPINPAGHKSLWVFERLARGEELALPNLGLETVHHVHADDVAQVFMGAVTHWSAAVGESFHAVSNAALTLRGFAEAAAGWFGQEARLTFMPFDEWKRTVTADEAGLTLDHISHSPNCSIAKAERLLGYRPRYTSLEAVHESVAWLIAHRQMDAPALQ